jgi:hypothetical protein
LPQPITNGHAARMRYSRFRSAMLGIEPQKRNRNTTNSKNKVTKSKKESRPVTKREDQDDEERDDPVKSEPDYNGQSAYSDYQAHLSNMRVKHEMSQQQQQQHHHNPYQPAHFNSPSPAGAESLRLLTPCSDDMLSVPHNLQFSPPPALIAGFDQMPSEPCTHGHEDHDVSNEPSSWAASPIFQPFDYHLNTYAIPDMSIFQRPDTSSGDGMLTGQHVEVKNEHWDIERR